MDKEILIQNIIRYCNEANIPPTKACVEARVGKDLLVNMRKGQTPSISKIADLAQYLGVTVSELLGETPNSRASADLDAATRAIADAYNAATPELQAAVRRVLGVE